MLNKIIKLLFKQWYKFVGHYYLLIMLIISYITSDYSNKLRVFIDGSITISFVLSIAFTINISFNYAKSIIKVKQNVEEINNLKVEIETNKFIIENYKNQMNIINNYKTTNIINEEKPLLALDLVKYTIEGNFFDPNPVEDSIKFVDKSINEVPGKTYYIHLKNKEINISLTKQKALSSYMRNTFQWISIDQGTALVNKNQYLIVFKIVNIGKKTALALYPNVITNNGNVTTKGITPTMLKKDEELLFLVLVDFFGKLSNNYCLEFRYNNDRNSYKQEINVYVDGNKLNQEIILTEPKLINSTKE